MPVQISTINVSRKVREMGKKQWQKPELIVLERNKPEEAVLLACKVSGRSSGNSTYNSRCYYNRAGSSGPTGTSCSTCNSVTAS